LELFGILSESFSLEVAHLFVVHDLVDEVKSESGVDEIVQASLHVDLIVFGVVDDLQDFEVPHVLILEYLVP